MYDYLINILTPITLIYISFSIILTALIISTLFSLWKLNKHTTEIHNIKEESLLDPKEELRSMLFKANNDIKELKEENKRLKIALEIKEMDDSLNKWV